jgi:hypothetical protein
MFRDVTFRTLVPQRQVWSASIAFSYDKRLCNAGRKGIRIRIREYLATQPSRCDQCKETCPVTRQVKPTLEGLIRSDGDPDFGRTSNDTSPLTVYRSFSNTFQGGWPRLIVSRSTAPRLVARPRSSGHTRKSATVERRNGKGTFGAIKSAPRQRRTQAKGRFNPLRGCPCSLALRWMKTISYAQASSRIAGGRVLSPPRLPVGAAWTGSRVGLLPDATDYRRLYRATRWPAGLLTAATQSHCF